MYRMQLPRAYSFTNFLKYKHKVNKNDKMYEIKIWLNFF